MQKRNPYRRTAKAYFAGWSMKWPAIVYDWAPVYLDIDARSIGNQCAKGENERLIRGVWFVAAADCVN